MAEEAAIPVSVNEVPTNRLWWKSWQFYLALFLGPIFWLGYQYFEPANVHWAFDYRYLLLVLVYPLVEEVVFRGLLQGQLRNLSVMRAELAGVSLANVSASIVFMSTHLLVQETVIAAADIFPSMVFGFLFDRYRTILPGVLVHVFYNAGFFILWSDLG